MEFLPCILLLFCVYNIKGKAITKDDLFEGDILLTDSTRPIVEAVNGNVSYDAVMSDAYKWPNAVVPYVFDPNFDSNRRRVVRQAIQEFQRYTCIKFVPRTNQPKYIRFFIGAACYSMIGMTSEAQRLSIGRGCNTKGVLMHEMMHAVGFWHEQSRLDRDKYITIYWQNIRAGQKHNFKKYRHGEADYYGEPYDYNSIMHYHSTAFSKNGRPTIVAKGNPKRRLGQRRGFTQIDVNQLNKLYKCKPKVIKPTPKPGPCTDSNRNCDYWASKGHCQKTRNWMHANCKKSCGLCGGGGKRKVDGGYGPWSRYGPCSATCGFGYQRRSRKCNQPAPANGGRSCTRLGGANQNRKCNLPACSRPIDGGFGPWSRYGPCSVTCGQGYQRRSRKCNQPAPANGGRSCTRLGPTNQNRKCNLPACQRPRPRPRPRPKPSSCKDNNRHCFDWARRGECRKNPRYMHVECKGSCGLCGCRDNHRYCADWARRGECGKNPAYMHKKCKKSCNRC